MTSPHFTLITAIWGQKLIYGFEIWHADYYSCHSCVGPMHTSIVRFFENFKMLDFRTLFPQKVVFDIIGVKIPL